MKRNDILKYFVDEYFSGNVSEAVKATEFTRAQFSSWISGDVTPSKETIEYLVHCIFTPEFKVIAEYYEFDATEKIRPQLREMLGMHCNSPGLYAFYDSMGNLLYIGKATNLLDESYDSIRRGVQLNFPARIRTAPEKRFEIIRYISAYDVGDSNWMDYPKHVESLILRISKPPLNKISGGLAPTYKRDAVS